MENQAVAAITRVQALADGGIQTVPPQYARSGDIETLQNPSHARDIQVPVIDLQDFNAENLREKTTAEIASAAENWGFFQIINHGIPESLIARVQAVGRAFFDLPMEDKEVYRNDGAGNPVGYGSKLGYTPDAKLDWGDYFYNVAWPPARRDLTKWPRQPSDFTEVMDEYGREVYKLWEELMQALCRGLGVEDENRLSESIGGEGKEIHFRINYYPPCPQPDLVLGLSPHSDPNALTILLCDQVPGLQIRKDGAWFHVQTIPGGLIVNIADAVEIVSNGKYKSIEHRGVVHKDRARMSWAMFCAPAREAIISPLKELVNQGNPALYGVSSYQEHLQKLFTRGVGGKTYVQQLRQL